MKYISTRNKLKEYNFLETFLNGLAHDGGLYVPKKYPNFSKKKLKYLSKLNYQELCFEIIKPFVENTFSKKDLKKIIYTSYKNFETNNVLKFSKLLDVHLVELYHGPTLAFKDIAMQIIGNMYENILRKKKNKINIITATSGDTGAAAINAIQKRKNINIFVLHPLNKISQTQRKLMTCIHSKNVFNIAVQGNFDDCQNLVKGMFNDYDFRMLINMTGVNSINWSRIFSQVVYFFYAHFKLSKNILSKSVFSVPTGNFGDIYAGYIAKKMGLPISNLIIATNENNILDRFLKTGIYKPTKVIQSISPSMDIQVASNFERLIFDYLGKNSQETKKLMENLKQKGFYKFSKSNLKKIKRTFYSNSVRSDEAKKEIKNIYSKYGKVIDPHTITAIKSINKLKKHFDKNTNYICLETAHPAKFRENISKIIKTKVELPKKIRGLIKKKERYCILPNSLEKIKKYILSKSLQLHF